MTVRFFSRRRGDGPPSTQFSATIVALPGVEPLSYPGQGVDAPNPDTLSPDSLVNLVTDASGANHAVPDVVTDIGGLPSEVPDPSDAPTLSHIGRYALKRQLGAGGIGTVFEAWDPLLSRAVAVKTLQFDVDQNARGSLDGLFLNEARAAASLNHRYIVTIHDAGLSPHGVYIAMERLYGRDLQRALAEGWRPTIEQSVQLIRRVTEALAFAHARGVVHCDIKPANIFLQRRDRPKVLDFGIARIVHGGALPALDGAVAGSPRYRSPEQLTGQPVDVRTDLYSLGVVMYELLTGRRACDGDTLAEINQAVLERDPTPAHEVDSRIPRDLSDIVSRAMARNPADRYTCASELSADLRRCAHGLQERQRIAATIQATPPAMPTTRPFSLARTGLVVGAAFLAAGAAALLLWAQPPTPPLHASAPASGTSAPARPAAAPPAATSEALAAPPGPPLALASSPSMVGNAAAGAVPATARNPAAPDVEPRPRAAASPNPAAPATGQVQLSISPWAELEVDGADSGLSPPVLRLTLSEGAHTITLRHPDFPPHSVQLQVSADKPLTVRHRFGP